MKKFELIVIEDGGPRKLIIKVDEYNDVEVLGFLEIAGNRILNGMVMEDSEP